MIMHIALVFLHLAGVAGVFVALGIELAGLSLARSSASLADVARAAKTWASNRAPGPIALVTTLATGIALSVQMGAASMTWVAPSIACLVAIALVGGLATGRKLMALDRAVAANDEPGALALAHDRVLVLSCVTRGALLAVLMLLMVAKP